MGAFKQELIEEETINTPTLSRELRAVLLIFEADEELKRKARPHLSVEKEEVNWAAIYKNDFGGGHSAALSWARAIWCARIETKSDPFDRAFAMDQRLQVAVLKALAIRWGLAVQWC